MALTNRGKNVWMIRVFLARDEDGKRLFLNETFHGNKADAKAREGKLLGDRQSGAVVRPTKETVRSYLDTWLDVDVKGSATARTEDDYRAICRRYIVPALGGKRLAKLTRTDVKRLYADMRERGLSSRTIQYARAVLHSALAEAVEDGKHATNPAAMKRRTKKNRQQQENGDPKVEQELHVWDAAQAQAFLAGVENDPHHAFWRLLLHTGLRGGGAVALRCTS